MMRSRAALAAISTAILAASGCTNTVQGVALRGETPVHTTTTTTRPAPQPVSPTQLEGALLTQQQLVDVAGGATLALVLSTNTTSDAAKFIDDHTCVGLASVGDVSIYVNSGWVAMRGNQFSTPNAVQADLTQVVTSFTTPADAQDLLQHTRDNWQGCANRRFGFHSSNGNHSHLDTAGVAGGAGRIQVSMRQEEDPRWGCSHAMTIQNSVVAESRVCLLNKDTAAAVNNLLDQLVARIPT